MTKMSRATHFFVFFGFLLVTNAFARPASESMADDLEEVEVCVSEECKYSAFLLQYSMNSSADPCDDFFQFACGGFIDKHPVKASSIDPWDQTFEAHAWVANAFLDAIDLMRHRTDMEILKAPSTFYQSCLNEKWFGVQETRIPFERAIMMFASKRDNCLGLTFQRFRWSIGAGYARMNPRKENITNVGAIFEEIKSGFQKMVEASTWMDAESKSKTMEKADAVNAVIGYHPSYLTDSEEPINALALKMNPLLLSSLFLTEDGKGFTVFTPASNVNPPYFNLGFEALDFGGIGVELASKLAHCYADFNMDMYAVSSRIWSRKTILKFKERKGCIAYQYAKEFRDFAPIKISKIRPKMDLIFSDENIAESSGLRAAFYAMKQKNLKKRTLVDLEQYSPEQLFFLVNANSLCSSETREYTEHVILDKGSGEIPSRFRVNVPMMNFDEFAKAWNCPLGSKMNPQEKCFIW